MISKIALDNNLDVAVVGSPPDAVMHCRQSESHVIYTEVTEALIFAVDDLYNRPLFTVAAPVNDEEVSLSEDEFIKSHECPFIV